MSKFNLVHFNDMHKAAEEHSYNTYKTFNLLSARNECSLTSSIMFDCRYLLRAN